jgi:hypothetical protein
MIHLKPDPSSCGPVPVALFTYARPDHVRRMLRQLELEKIPLLYAFSDGPAHENAQQPVEEVRRLLKEVTWCDTKIRENPENLGLGTSIMQGVSEVLRLHPSVIVLEEDLILVPGFYLYLSAALEQYGSSMEVMSVTGWTHPRVTPDDARALPYFDGRAECWGWGTWRRGWEGMEQNARSLMKISHAKGIDLFRYGADLPLMAMEEQRRNTWAARWSLWHLVNRGLCMRPPWSMVEHDGAGDAMTTHVKSAGTQDIWSNAPLQPAPPIPPMWPAPAEHTDVARLWRLACGGRPGFLRRWAIRLRW